METLPLHRQTGATHTDMVTQVWLTLKTTCLSAVDELLRGVPSIHSSNGIDKLDKMENMASGYSNFQIKGNLNGYCFTSFHVEIWATYIIIERKEITKCFNSISLESVWG